jgi:hypothetical protein
MNTHNESPEKPGQGQMEALSFFLGKTVANLVLHAFQARMIIVQVALLDRVK